MIRFGNMHIQFDSNDSTQQQQKHWQMQCAVMHWCITSALCDLFTTCLLVMNGWILWVEFYLFLRFFFSLVTLSNVILSLFFHLFFSISVFRKLLHKKNTSKQHFIWTLVFCLLFCFVRFCSIFFLFAALFHTKCILWYLL